MSLFLFDNKGTPLSAQKFTWRDLVQKPISKLDDDAFTRIRVIAARALEARGAAVLPRLRPHGTASCAGRSPTCAASSSIRPR